MCNLISYREEGSKLSGILFKLLVIVIQSVGILRNLFALAVHFGFTSFQFPEKQIRKTGWYLIFLPLDLIQLCIVLFHACSDTSDTFPENHVGLWRPIPPRIASFFILNFN